MPVTLFSLDEDTTLDGSHDGAVITNRSASGSITITLPDSPSPGTVFEIHQAETYQVTIRGQSAGDNILGAGQELVLSGPGNGVRLVYTAPHFWSGL